MRYPLLALLPIWVTATHGCQWLANLDQSRRVETAHADHAECSQRGYSWPSESYVECRRFITDERQREQWLELQMSRPQRQADIVVQDRPGEPYRPIPPQNFACAEQTTREREPYIACFEQRSD